MNGKTYPQKKLIPCDHAVVMCCSGFATVTYSVKPTADGDVEVREHPAIDWDNMSSYFECTKCGADSIEELGINEEWEWL